MTSPLPREIPFNYTSADDRQAVIHLLGDEVWEKLERLRERRVTGRSARLLLRVVGELLVHRRNPYLWDEVISSQRRRRILHRRIEADLAIVERNAGEERLVLEVVAACREAVAAFRREAAQAPAERERLLAALGPVVGRENVLFDPFTIVAHATDATDWRLHLPLAVVTPGDEASVAPLLATVAALGLHAIPRGAGTGLTGGAVPLHPRCVVVNTEKLNRIRGIDRREFRLPGGGAAEAEVMRVEAGVVTETAIEHAAERGLVFATDPTSAWACTIGGNVAENAGGKTAVLWGTCIDNLLAWTMAMPSGATWTVRREDHRLRKILHDDVVRWTVHDAAGTLLRRVELRGDELRKRGLWKDITNKALGGLPGVQKEGTDGVVTSAEFVLYRQYEASRTLCLEFFGPDMDEASKVILELSRAFPDEGKEVLQALEHFDDQYVQAIRYEVKAPRGETPKAVLLVDVVGHSAEEAERGVERIRGILARHASTFLAEARDRVEAKRFWADRKKLGAIAKRTNAFKLNEDVVLPLEALAEFARFCDAVNVEQERENQRAAIDRADEHLGMLPPPAEDGEWRGARVAHARARCAAAREALAAAGDPEVKAVAAVEALRRDLGDLLRTYPEVERGVAAAIDEVRSRRILLATHMHAGDGNVHVNIPVMSNDRAMMRRAEEIVDRVMARVAELGGVCSGEHGIGVTKLKYLDPARKAELAAYRATVDPQGVMNPGKLADLALLDRIYTPSFNLLELEARILQHGQLEELATRIAGCIRCGKCKPDCCVYHPARGMFFHPRNKNLAIGALVEALLYDAQRDRSTGFELLRHLEELADHCTICHKCAKPCPVAIDTGDVSILERRILAARGYKRTSPATSATLRYLYSSSPALNAVFRAGVVTLGGALQRALARALAPARDTAAGRGPLQLLRSPVPPADPGTLRSVLPRCEPDQALVLEPDGDARATVFYFPGCGSERLFSRVAKAAVHLLLETGTRVVLPPPFLCCGFPHHANAKEEAHGRTVLRDTIVFSQMREMFRYLDFDAVVVTCGTCREALGAMEAGKIFGCDVVDVARFALSRGLSVPGGGAYLYHTPCHDSLDGKGPEVLAKLGGLAAERVPHCCSEAGTLALSRPDITDAMLHRKRAALEESLREHAGAKVMLTNCPSCLQGLGRHHDLPLEVRHVAVELARAASGAAWEQRFAVRAARATAVRF
jgi:FAD/FMN-containing dehydrogenase/Fe-S oxidoreductase